MLSALVPIFRTPELRRKILIVLGILVLYRLGATLPSPGVNFGTITECVDKATSGDSGQVYSLINMFSGGALLQLSVFAIGIMPYITASIIIQLLMVVIPRFETLRKEGQAGQAKITQYTRYLTVALALLLLRVQGPLRCQRAGDRRDGLGHRQHRAGGDHVAGRTGQPTGTAEPVLQMAALGEIHAQAADKSAQEKRQAA